MKYTGRLRLLVIANSSGIGLLYHLTKLSIALKKAGHDVCVLSEPKEQVDGLSSELQNYGVKHYQFKHIDRRSIVSILLSAKEIKRIVEKEDINIIHAQGILQAFAAQLSTKKSKKYQNPSIVTTIHHIPNESHLDQLRWVVMKSILRSCSDTVIPVSENTREQLTQHGIDSDKLITIHNAIDLSLFDKYVESAFSCPNKSNRPNIVCGGNLIPRKGHYYYLKAASELLKTTDATFYIVGNGPERYRLEELSRRLGIKRNVIFTGRLSWPDMYSFFSNVADIFVSASSGELFPYYVLECMAASKPIVATNVGGVSEAVRDGINGYVVPPRDHLSLASAISKILNCPSKAAEMGKRSRMIVEEEFSLPNMVCKLTDCYKLSISKRNSLTV